MEGFGNIPVPPIHTWIVIVGISTIMLERFAGNGLIQFKVDDFFEIWVLHDLVQEQRIALSDNCHALDVLDVSCGHMRHVLVVIGSVTGAHLNLIVDIVTDIDLAVLVEVEAQLDEHHQRVYGGIAAAYAAARPFVGLPPTAQLRIE